VKVTTALVTPACVNLILSPITPPFTKVAKFGSIVGMVLTKAIAAFALEAGKTNKVIGSDKENAKTKDMNRFCFNL
jgi:hypothetical protein